jgi:peptidoglycan-N-acetylglucosamine deacetylase
MGCFLFALILSYLWGTVVWPRRYVVPQVFGEAIFSVQTTEPLIALTFDDGPNPAYTPQILDILAAHGVKATFFMVGRAIEAHPEVAAQVMQQGHEIGNHTWHHYSLNYLGPRAIHWELESTDDLIRQLGYQAPIPFRSPYGHSLLFLPWVLNQMHRANVLWSIDPKDWDAKSADEVITRLDGNLHCGGILLLHDGDATPDGLVYGTRAPTVEAVEQILTTYSAQGYRFVTLSELMAAGPRALWGQSHRVVTTP